MRIALLCAGSVLALGACGTQVGDASPDASASGDAIANVTADAAPGSCNYDYECGGGMKCSNHMCVVGGCGQSTLNLSYVAPNLLFVVDRSCSMKNIPNGSAKTKWQMAVDALEGVITIQGTNIRWGMTLFPDKVDGACTQQAFPFPVADDNGPAIQTLLTQASSTSDPLYPANGPCATNIDAGLQQAATDPGLSDATRKSYLMLVTDGAQSTCTAAGGDAGSEAIVADLFGNRGISTFVVGFGNAVDATELDKLANAGGVPVTGGTHAYYQAESQADLDAVLASIADAVTSCSYKLDAAPPSIDKTYVWFEKTTKVARDITHADGWDFDPATNTVTFYGGSCDQLRTHTVDTVDVVYDCDGPLL